MSELNELLDSMDNFEVNPQGDHELPEDNDIVEASVEQPEETGAPKDADDGEVKAGDEPVIKTEPETGGGDIAKEGTPDKVGNKSELESQSEHRESEFWRNQYKERQSLEDKRWNQYQKELSDLKAELKEKRQSDENPPPDLSQIDDEYIKAVEYVVGRKLAEFEKDKLPQRIEGLQQERDNQRQAQVQSRLDMYKTQFDELVEKGTITEELAPAMIEYYHQNAEDAIQKGSNTFVYNMLEYARQKNSSPKPSATKQEKETVSAVSRSGKQPKPKDGVVIKSKEDLLDYQ